MKTTMSSIAILAALAMALVSATSVMAEGPTALCTADELVCAGKNLAEHVHETSVGKAKFLSSLPTIECNVLFLGDVLKPLAAKGEKLVIHGHFTYSSCNNFCSYSEPAGQDALVPVLRRGAHLAGITYEYEVHVSCPFINCTYNGEGLEGHALDPLTSSQANGSVNIAEQEMHIVSGACPESTFLDFTTTPLEKVYVSE